eukprot:344807-Hanusia_phi.AAC.12
MPECDDATRKVKLPSSSSRPCSFSCSSFSLSPSLLLLHFLLHLLIMSLELACLSSFQIYLDKHGNVAKTPESTALLLRHVSKAGRYLPLFLSLFVLFFLFFFLVSFTPFTAPHHRKQV